MPLRTTKFLDIRFGDLTDLKPLLVALLPTSYQFKKGHRIRIALAGADNDHFQALDGPAPAWEVWHTANRPSHVELPVIR